MSNSRGPFVKGQPESHASFGRQVPEGPSAAAVAAAMQKHEAAIAELLTRYPESRAALLPTLHLLQPEFGWLPPSVQKAVAHRLHIAPGEVFRVVEFYTLFHGRPCGKRHVMVCGTLSCELGGANKVLKALEAELGIKAGETTPDGKVSIERVECLGWCDRAPVVQVNEDDYLDKVTPDQARDLARTLKGSAQ